MGYLINNKTKQIQLTRGDTLKLKVNILVDNQEYVPDAEDYIRFAMKSSYDSSKVLIDKQIPTDTLILHLQPNETKRFPFGRYVYDIQITFANGDVDTFIKGEIELTPEVK